MSLSLNEALSLLKLTFLSNPLAYVSSGVGLFLFWHSFSSISILSFYLDNLIGMAVGDIFGKTLNGFNRL